VVILGERQLRRVLQDYVEIYFNHTRPQQGLFQRIPALAASRSVSEVRRNVAGLPVFGGLHHDYPRVAQAPIIRAGAHVDGKDSQLDKWVLRKNGYPFNGRLRRNGCYPGKPRPASSALSGEPVLPRAVEKDTRQDPW
jgi:hypothetical protein